MEFEYFKKGFGIVTESYNAIYSKDKSKIANAFLIYCKYNRLEIKLVSKGFDRRRKAEK